MLIGDVVCRRRCVCFLRVLGADAGDPRGMSRRSSPVDSHPRARAPRGVGFALLALLAGVTLGAPAQANGRYPTSQFLLVGPGASSDVMALRTTFGLVESVDGGRSWTWLCEDVFDYGFGPPYDPPIALGARGADGVPLMVSLTDGLMRTTNFCAAERVPEVDREFSGDITSVGNGETIFWVASNGRGIRNRVFVSRDAGRTFAPLNDGLAGVLFETIEVAPSDPMRMYLAGVTDSEPQRATFHRSDDGGRTLREIPIDLQGGRDAFVSGIDPTDADVVYVRSTLEDGDGAVTGTLLLRSRDGGEHFEVALRSSGPMLGFALSGDGRTVWAGGPDPNARLMRSDDGAPFARVSDVEVLCLRWHPSGLYICANHIVDGFAVGRSNDQGATVAPLLRFRDLTGPSASCAPGTAGHDLCPGRWSQVSALLGIPDPLPMDAGASAQMDAAAGVDAAAPPPPTSSCMCAAHRAQSPSTAWSSALAVALGFRRRKRR